MMRTKSWVLAVTTMFVLVLAAMRAVSQESTQDSSKVNAGIMRMKLEPAKKILEGIALGDFQAIRKNAEQIRLLTLDEKWMVVQSDRYQLQTKNFEKSLNLLNRMCEERDIDGVTLAYMQVTMRCVECHRVIRGDRN